MVNEDEVKKIARLARLEIESEFIPVVTSHMNSILGYVERLNAIDTSQAAAMSHVSDTTNVLRQDIMLPAQPDRENAILQADMINQQPMLPTDDLLRNAPDSSGSFIRVPLIVE